MDDGLLKNTQNDQPVDKTELSLSDKTRIVKPELQKAIKKNGKKIGGVVLVLALILGSLIVSRGLVQQRLVGKIEAAGGCASSNDVGNTACSSWTEVATCQYDTARDYFHWMVTEDCTVTLENSISICSAGKCVLNPGVPTPTPTPGAPVPVNECTWDSEVYCVGNYKAGGCYWGGEGNRYACWKLHGTYGITAHSSACADYSDPITGSDGVSRNYQYYPEYGYLFMLSTDNCYEGDVLPDGRNTAYTCSDDPIDLAKCEPPPTPTPTPTPEPIYSCVGLSKPEEIVLGDTANFSCEASFSAESPVAYFRYKVGAGTYVEEPTAKLIDSSTKKAVFDLEIDQVGAWVVQCKVCTDTSKTSCTSWGQAN